MFINKDKKASTVAKITIEEKVTFLQQPRSYPFSVSEIKSIETHMSWVFLADDFVYKMKKPVSYRLFDHRTLESRFTNSVEEVRINKRLAKDIYIGIVPLVINKTGILQLEGEGEIVDWLVKMKRIPEKNMLSYAIEHDCIDEAQLHQAATLLATFYKTAPPVSFTLSEYIGKLDSEILFNHDQLMAPVFELPETLIKELTAGQRAFIIARQEIFEKRITGNKIIDAHGDLRPEHICLAPQVAIIDRLEFSKELRLMDPVQELSLLSVECEMMGNSHIGHLFIDVYSELTHDTIPTHLIHFFKIKSACLRAYLVARHIEEPRYKDDPKWLTKANAYLELAERYHQQLAD
jgi:aminoglycoside phosphotransferase family enzyme